MNPDKTPVLSELGIYDGISEVIVTTERNGIPNAAPIGIIKRGESISVRLFRGSHTYENVIATHQLVANVTHDPWIFVEAALTELPELCFQRREGLAVLKGAEAWAHFSCALAGDDPLVVHLKLVSGEVMRREVRAFNRGTNAILEAAVHATRYLALKDGDHLADVKRLMQIVKRCGGPGDLEAMRRLEKHLGI